MYHESQCGCGQHGHREESGVGYGHGKWQRHHGGCSCCCFPRGGMHHGHGGMLKRHFTSKGEIITKLEEYLEQLQSEVKGVEEHIAELKK